MHLHLLLAAVLPLVGASAVQQPLVQGSQALDISDSKKLVSSHALQDDISTENLLERAKALFEIAKLGEKEYNHPTRVIGSDGIQLSYLCVGILLMKQT